MGADSATSTEDGDRSIQRLAKVFTRNGMLFGCSGEMRVGQLIQHAYELPTPGAEHDPEQYVIRDLGLGLRAFLHEHAEELLPGPEDDEMWSLLVGLRGRVFRLCSHLTASESATGYEAIGSGAPYAVGSLATTEDMTDPHRRVEMALRAAERHDGGTAPPFTIISL
jgi:hypothetical protein